MTIESVSESVSDLAADILTGAEAIGKEIGENRRKTFYLLSRGLIPGRKQGGAWISTRSALRKHYDLGPVA